MQVQHPLASDLTLLKVMNGPNTMTHLDRAAESIKSALGNASKGKKRSREERPSYDSGQSSRSARSSFISINSQSMLSSALQEDSEDSSGASAPQRTPRNSLLSVTTGQAPEERSGLAALDFLSSECSRAASEKEASSAQAPAPAPAPAPRPTYTGGIPPKGVQIPGVGLLVRNASSFISMSFDAMAVISGDVGLVLSSNQPFHNLAMTLGGGQLEEGIHRLQLHFRKLLAVEPAMQTHYSCQEIQGNSTVVSVKSAIQRLAATHRQFLWVISAQQSQAPALIVSEPRLADPLITVLAPSAASKRARAAGQPVTAGSEFQTQNLWLKYGEKVLSKGTNANSKVRRAYFKCYSTECLARLTVDTEPESGERLQVRSLGVHNHAVNVDKSSDDSSVSSSMPSLHTPNTWARRNYDA